MSQSRYKSGAAILNFKTSMLPFAYLGVPIFKGKAKFIHLQGIDDMVKVKLSAWNALQPNGQAKTKTNDQPKIEPAQPITKPIEANKREKKSKLA